MLLECDGANNALKVHSIHGSTRPSGNPDTNHRLYSLIKIPLAQELIHSTLMVFYDHDTVAHGYKTSMTS